MHVMIHIGSFSVILLTTLVWLGFMVVIWFPELLPNSITKKSVIDKGKQTMPMYMYMFLSSLLMSYNIEKFN